MSKWFVRSKTMWVNGLILAGGTALVGPEELNTVFAQVDQMAIALAPTLNIMTRFTTSEEVGHYGKNPVLSKTLLINFAIIGFAIYQIYTANVAGEAFSNLWFVLLTLGIANLYLRFVSDTPITLLPRFH